MNANWVIYAFALRTYSLSGMNDSNELLMKGLIRQHGSFDPMTMTTKTEQGDFPLKKRRPFD
ncbi:hypothetical protein A0J61_04590 [Choanephora cucurbitarum]|uniref:Uncharacterized protein n=1 Tax=Choanephora cucurbitarum TaxID=101091 RepID=A0A1C7NJ59_9FUNG|nr:hypothetical protein A0J61_04590 [Choanephora cucurbitarum]